MTLYRGKKELFIIYNSKEKVTTYMDGHRVLHLEWVQQDATIG